MYILMSKRKKKPNLKPPTKNNRKKVFRSSLFELWWVPPLYLCHLKSWHCPENCGFVSSCSCGFSCCVALSSSLQTAVLCSDLPHLLFWLFCGFPAVNGTEGDGDPQGLPKRIMGAQPDVPTGLTWRGLTRHRPALWGITSLTGSYGFILIVCKALYNVRI